jgi:rhodanese-related sulfurtransferase
MRGFVFITVLMTSVIPLACAPAKRITLDTAPPSGALRSTVNEISPHDALPKVEAAYSQFVDVRSPAEYAAGHAARSINIPLETLADNLDRLERNEPVYLICETGRRSGEAAEILSANGFEWTFSVAGGTSAWREERLPMETSPAEK